MARDTARFSPDIGSIYSYLEEYNWYPDATQCTFDAFGGVTSDFGWGATVHAQLQWWENGTWHDFGSEGSEWFTGYGDKKIVSHYGGYFARGASDRSVRVGCLCWGTINGTYTEGRAWLSYTVPHLVDAPTLGAVSRVSDNQISIAWTNPSQAYEAMCIEVQTDGGSWSQVAVLWNTATSYQWNGAAADHSYKVRIRAYYVNSYSAYSSEPASIVMTPTAPQSLTTSATSGTTVTVNLVNPSNVATGIKYQLSSNGSTWGTSTTVSGSPVTSFSVDMTTNRYIRVCNTNSTGDSGWLTSGEIITVTKPNKPTITSDANGGTWSADKDLTITWGYSNADGSPQEAYKYQYSIYPYSSTSSSANITSATDHVTYEPEDIIEVGETMRWRVAVKGASATWSDYSDWLYVTLKTAPTVNITSPSASVTAMPLSISATYTDAFGTCAEANYYLQGNGQRYPQSGTLPLTVTTSGGVTTLSASITASDFIPDNGASYTVYVTARSSSSLQSTANATFQTAFTEPTAGDLSIQNDPDTGYVSLLATFDNDGSDIEYSGNTNQQYDCEPAYVKSLTIDGKSEIQSDFQLPIALYKTGYSVNASGVETSNANFRIYQTTDVYEGESVICTFTLSTLQNVYARVHLYDSNGWVAQMGYAIFGEGSDTELTKTITFTVPSKGYLRLSLYTTTKTKTVVVPSRMISIEHVTVIGRNMLNLLKYTRYYASSCTGIVIGSNELNIYPNGTGSTWCHYDFYWDDLLESGQAYTLICKYSGNTNNLPFGIGIRTSDDTGYVYSPNTNKQTAESGEFSFTFTAYGTTLGIWWYINYSGSGASPVATVTIKDIMLEKGSVAHDYEPYSAQVIVGDNLLDVFNDFPKTSTNYQSCHIENNNNGTFTVSGTNSGGNFGFNSTTGSVTLPAGMYTFSGNGNLRGCNLAFTVNGSDVNITTSSPFKTVVYNEPATLTKWKVSVANGATISGTCYPMIERGSVAHDFTIRDVGYVPLRSAGSVHDQLQAGKDEWTVERKVGSVDLGSLTWTAAGTDGQLYSSGISSLVKIPASFDTTANVLCAKYATVTRNELFASSGYGEMCIAGNGNIIVRDSVYPDKDALKTLLNGVYLFYELATPTTDTPTSYSTIEIGTAFTVGTELDSTFSMTSWDGAAEADTISVSRVNADGTTTPLLADGASGSGVVDKYAPLNTAYQYAVTTTSAAHAIKTVYVDNILRTPRFFFYFDDYIASALWVPTERISPTRPHREELYFSGRTLPMSIDDEAEGESRSLSFQLRTRDEANAFHKLKHHSGSSIYKSSMGAVMHANVTIELEPAFKNVSIYGGLSIRLVQVSGVEL